MGCLRPHHASFPTFHSLGEKQSSCVFHSHPKKHPKAPKASPDLQPFIHLVPISFPPLDPGLLPEGAEATVDLPSENTENLKIAFDLLAKPIRQFIGDQSVRPDWIITDFAAHWVVDIGEEYGIPIIFFSVLTAATCVVFSSTEQDPSSAKTLTSPPDLADSQSMVAYREYEAVKMQAGLHGVNDSGFTDGQRHGKIISACKAVAIRSCNEFDPEYLQAYRKIIGRLVIPIGLLPPEKPISKTKNAILEWLDKQKPRSVMFVGFGSECKLTKEQVFELAHGLELTGLPFIWALRKPNWANTDADALPQGFVERSSEKGLVSLGWVPQLEILGHPSIGGSLFHSGWGSIIEMLQFGHVLVVLPFIIDQPLNGRLLEEKGLAIEVKRGEYGSFTKDEISKALIHALVAEEGEQLRANARKAAKVFGDHKLHQDYIGQFVHFLKSYVTERSS